MPDLEHLSWSMLPPELREKARAYEELLRKWNRKVNLVSRKGGFNFRTEFLDSLYPWLAGLFRDGASVLDLGSGGGFPVIPLALAAGDRHRFVALESIHKKSVFLKEAARALGLKNLEVVPGRAGEKLPAAGDYLTVKKSLAPDGEAFYNLLNNNGLEEIFYYAGGEEPKILYFQKLETAIRRYSVISPQCRRTLAEIKINREGYEAREGFSGPESNRSL